MGGMAVFPRSSERGPIEALHTAEEVEGSFLEFPRSSERGPIEALGCARAKRARSHFRAHLSAAPLKPANLSDDWPSWAPYFRAHLSAAPLKRAVILPLPPRAVDFRAHLSAAPLKQLPLASAERWGSIFPRSSERGPIEALGILTMLSTVGNYFRAHLSAAPLKLANQIAGRRNVTGFPRSSERGPIEARESSCPLAHLAHGGFPRSSERGPIEAQTMRYRSSRRILNFRAHLSAAPLKRGGGLLMSRRMFISALI